MVIEDEIKFGSDQFNNSTTNIYFYYQIWRMMGLAQLKKKLIEYNGLNPLIVIK